MRVPKSQASEGGTALTHESAQPSLFWVATGHCRHGIDEDIAAKRERGPPEVIQQAQSKARRTRSRLPMPLPLL